MFVLLIVVSLLLGYRLYVCRTPFLRLVVALAALLVALSSMALRPADTGQLLIEGLPDEAGTLYVGWYDQADAFPKAGKVMHGQKVKAQGPDLVAVAGPDLPPGRYAISAFFDLNGNGELDTNFLGIPTEPYGFSNRVRPAMRAATFEEAAFQWKAGATVRLELK